MAIIDWKTSSGRERIGKGLKRRGGIGMNSISRK